MPDGNTIKKNRKATRLRIEDRANPKIPS